MTETYRSLVSEERPGFLRFGGARMALLDIEAAFWGLRRQLEALVGKTLTDNVLQQAGANGGASFARAFASTDPAVDGSRRFGSASRPTRRLGSVNSKSTRWNGPSASCRSMLTKLSRPGWRGSTSREQHLQCVPIPPVCWLVS